MLLGTTAIAAIIGLIVGNLFKLGVGNKVVEATKEIREITSVVDTLRGLLPSNHSSIYGRGKYSSSSNICSIYRK